MEQQRQLWTGLVAIGALLAQGCAGLEAEKNRDWSAEPEVGGLAETHALADGSRLAVGNTRNVAIVDGDTGDAIGVLGEEGFNLQPTIRVAGAGSYTMNAETYDVLYLEDSEVMLVVDYDGANESIMAIDIRSGEKLWRRSGYDFSHQQYDQFISQAAQALAGPIADALGANVEGESRTERHERQRDFAQGLAVAVDDGDGLLFKTFDGLVKFDLQTGNEQWRVEDFNGPGIQQVSTLDNGDYLVLSSGENLFALQAASSYDLLRVSPGGEVRWITEHSGQRTGQMVVAENRVAVDAWPLQVFDLDSGNQLWENDVMRRLQGGRHDDPGDGTGQSDDGPDATDPRSIAQPAPLIRDGVLYQAAWTHQADEITVGLPPHKVRAYDLDSGEELWTTGEVEAYFGELFLINDQLIVWGTGDFFGEDSGAAGIDINSGEIAWRSPEIDGPGFISESLYVVPPVFNETRDRMFIAGVDELYGISLPDGDTFLEVDLGELGIGHPLGMERHGSNVVVAANSGAAAFDMARGDQQFATTIDEHAIRYQLRGDRVVLELQDTLIGDLAADGDFTVGARAIDLNNGNAGDLVVWQDPERPVFGLMARGRIFVSEDGRHAFGVGEDGALIRYTL